MQSCILTEVSDCGLLIVVASFFPFFFCVFGFCVCVCMCISVRMCACLAVVYVFVVLRDNMRDLEVLVLCSMTFTTL